VALVALVTVATLLAVLLRPRGVAEGVSALGGGALMVAIGAVAPGAAAALLLNAWNVFGFFLGLMLIAAAADHAGVFDALAWQAARLAGGSPRRLLLNVFVVGVVLTAFLSNDATALVLTPWCTRWRCGWRSPSALTPSPVRSSPTPPHSYCP
jgi:arsenical pump membrane protein